MTLFSELLLAGRSLSRAKGLVAVAVLSLALGIGVNGAIFTYVNAIEFRPLPFRQASELVDVSEDSPAELCAGCSVGTSWSTLSLWRTRARSFIALEAYRESSYTLAGEGEPERTGGAQVTAGLFPLLGVQPAIGRGFAAAEDRPGGDAVVLLSHRLWTRRFGADSAALGRSLRVNGVPHRIIGVMPEGIRFPEFASLWVPLAAHVVTMAPDDRSLAVVGRLRSGTSAEGAGAEMAGIAASLAIERPEVYRGWNARVVPLREDLSDDSAHQAFWVALAASGFVLLIACANLANLLLARASGRARELAVRVALGAGRTRVAGHVLAESFLLGLAGGALGLLLSVWGVRLITSMIPSDLPAWLTPATDWRVAAWTLFLSIATGLALGILPALRAARGDWNQGLKAGAQGATAGRADGRIRSSLAVAQVALALVLLAGTGLILKSFLVVRRTDNLGYDPRGVLMASFQLLGPRYESAGRVGQFAEELLARVRVQPSVQGAAIEHTTFLGSFIGDRTEVRLEGSAEPLRNSEAPRFLHAVSPEYFDVMRIPVLKGRGIGAEDRPGTPAVAAVSAFTAERLWPGEDALGKRINLGSVRSGQWHTVVGIVGDVIGSPLGRTPGMLVYTAAAQGAARPFNLLLRHGDNAGTLGAELRAVARTLDPDQPVEDVMPMEDALARWIAPVRFMVTLFGGLGLLAATLAGFGIYGVLSYVVARRTRELGIRMALGAEVGHLRRYVVARGLRLAVIGLVIGLPAAWLLARALASILFTVHPGDPAVFALVAAALTVVVLLACWIPARRATRVNPVDALRFD
jgi:putative ABC transport system permease protein